MMTIIFIVAISLMVPTLVIAGIMGIEVRRKKRVRIALQRILNVLTEQHRLWVMTIEFFKNKFIGIDTANKKLVFAEYRKEKKLQCCIDLDSVLYCRVTKTIDKHTREVREIFLQLKSIDADDNYRLVFYNSMFDDKRSRGLLLGKARDWKNQINKQISRDSYHYSSRRVL